jgi:hypothetical protein
MLGDRRMRWRKGWMAGQLILNQRDAGQVGSTI